MTRHQFGTARAYAPAAHDPRDGLGTLATAFDEHFEPDTLRALLNDVQQHTGEAWQDITRALTDALAAAEHPRPAAGRMGYGYVRGILYSERGDYLTPDPDGVIRDRDGRVLAIVTMAPTTDRRELHDGHTLPAATAAADPARTV